jgi:hypothetical protein
VAAVTSIREALPITGRRIVEITTTDFEPGMEESRVYLHLDDGSTVSFAIGDGNLGFSYDGFPDGHPFLEDAPDEGEDSDDD